MSELRKYIPIENASKLVRKVALGVAIVVAPIHQEQLKAQEHNASNPTVQTEWAFVSRLNNKGEFLVTRQNVAVDRPEAAFGEGLRYMLDHGCQIADIKPVNGGDIVKVTNPDKCLPQTK